MSAIAVPRFLGQVWSRRWCNAALLAVRRFSPCTVGKNFTEPIRLRRHGEVVRLVLVMTTIAYVGMQRTHTSDGLFGIF
jgi:hypothetical protein